MEGKHGVEENMKERTVYIMGLLFWWFWLNGFFIVCEAATLFSAQ